MTKYVAAAVAALIATLVPGATSSAATTVTIEQHGGKVFRGQHLLAYPSRATISGVVQGASTGTRVTLEQLAFPFHGSYSETATTTTGAGGSYAFRVRPSIATRYRAISGGSASSVVIYYMTAGGKSMSLTNCVGQSTCHATWVFDGYFPSSVAGKETRKHVFVYDGIRSGSLPPNRLNLNTHATTSVTRLTSSRYRYAISWTMQFPTRSTWQVNECTRDTFSADGFGLPEANRCGDASIPNPVGYLG